MPIRTLRFYSFGRIPDGCGCYSYINPPPANVKLDLDAISHSVLYRRFPNRAATLGERARVYLTYPDGGISTANVTSTG